MRCWRVDLRHDFSRYLNGELGPRQIERLERHLLDCGSCREHLSRMRSGHRFAQNAPGVAPERDVWLAVESAIEAEQSGPAAERLPPSGGRWSDVIRKPGFAVAAVVIASLVVGLLIFLSRQTSTERDDARLIANAFELRDFHPVTIAGIEHNTEPHVVAEGYVSEVRIDHEDGDLLFKLVDDISQAGPFIVCEIINPKKFAPPLVGSRVRVYGVSRYDAKSDHQWYEVHPVLSIEVVSR